MFKIGCYRSKIVSKFENLVDDPLFRKESGNISGSTGCSSGGPEVNNSKWKIYGKLKLRQMEGLTGGMKVSLMDLVRGNELVITAVHGGLPLLKWIFLDLTWFVTGGAIELPIVILIEFGLGGSRLVLVLACIHNTENKTKGNDHAYNSDADHGSSILI